MLDAGWSPPALPPELALLTLQHLLKGEFKYALDARALSPENVIQPNESAPEDKGTAICAFRGVCSEWRRATAGAALVHLWAAAAIETFPRIRALISFVAPSAAALSNANGDVTAIDLQAVKLSAGEWRAAYHEHRRLFFGQFTHPRTFTLHASMPPPIHRRTLSEFVFIAELYTSPNAASVPGDAPIGRATGRMVIHMLGGEFPILEFDGARLWPAAPQLPAHIHALMQLSGDWQEALANSRLEIYVAHQNSPSKMVQLYNGAQDTSADNIFHFSEDDAGILRELFSEDVQGLSCRLHGLVHTVSSRVEINLDVDRDMTNYGQSAAEMGDQVARFIDHALRSSVHYGHRWRYRLDE